MRGFALVELLVALVITSALAAGIAAVVPPSRIAFEHTPAALDVQQRGRTATDVITQAVRSAGMPGLFPSIALLDPHPDGERFAALRAITRRLRGAEGILAADQPGVSGVLTLSLTSCPDVEDVCGFLRGAAAVIADGSGRFDLFVIDEADEGARRIVSDRPFPESYPAGAIVMEVDAETYRLEAQPDGSQALVRETVAGAVQPIVDRLRALGFSRTDARLDVRFLVEPVASQRPGARAHQFSIHMRNAS